MVMMMMMVAVGAAARLVVARIWSYIIALLAIVPT